MLVDRRTSYVIVGGRAGFDLIVVVVAGARASRLLYLEHDGARRTYDLPLLLLLVWSLWLTSTA